MAAISNICSVLLLAMVLFYASAETISVTDSSNSALPSNPDPSQTIDVSNTSLDQLSQMINDLLASLGQNSTKNTTALPTPTNSTNSTNQANSTNQSNGNSSDNSDNQSDNSSVVSDQTQNNSDQAQDNTSATTDNSLANTGQDSSTSDIATPTQDPTPT